MTGCSAAWVMMYCTVARRATYSRGGPGADTLEGNSGDDMLEGGAGADTMDGGIGFDTFIFDLGHGMDTITDFRNGQDLIDISAFGLSGLDDLALRQLRIVCL